LPVFPQTCPKGFCATIFSYKGHEDLFWYDLQEKVIMCFCGVLQTLGAILAWIFRNFAQIFKDPVEIITILPRFSRILPGFSGISPEFSTNQ